MSEEAINDLEIEDVSDVIETTQQKDRALTPREEKLAMLVQKHNEGTQQFTPDLTAGDDAADEADKETEQKPEEKPESPVYLNDKGEYVMKLKVNGVEVERSVEQIRSGEQKSMAAEQRLDEAVRRLAEAEQREKQLTDYQVALDAERQRLEQLAGSQLSQDVGNSENDVKELAARHRQLVYDGDDAAADEVMAQMISIGRQQPTQNLNIENIVNQAVQHSMREQQRIALESQRQSEQQQQQEIYNNSLQSGIAWAKENHAELLSDPDLYQLIDSKTADLSRDEPDETPENIIKKAVVYVAERFGKKSPTENPRQANKQSLPVQPKRLANSRHSPPKKEQVDTSPAGVIARERARRAANQNRPT